MLFLKKAILKILYCWFFKYLLSNLILYFSPLTQFILHKITEVENSILSIFVHKKMFTIKWINYFFLLPSRQHQNRTHTRFEHDWPEIDPNPNFTRSEPVLDPNGLNPKLTQTEHWLSIERVVAHTPPFSISLQFWKALETVEHREMACFPLCSS